ncbi:MAG: acyl-CoA dehydrogenase [Henriciella sp.]|jgi:acyl-CoA dehydrogenase|uniref:acyl-CoA dehydrogenase family protein n=1 Tax=Henriciella sp. TaxID=1968823 RepID=UPI000C0EF7EA|nr:acyl-CoA dehydrogenase family protein [Henriciella sp.]MAN74841.1 acyl-CoA dehydrogenase [Henriciella sp.]MBF34152.1 acyl-CoA dehydrogenase [Hyphomonadaceae bacterium]PHR81970.1 MAG: acyl-CoA dehydrogenase [Henriciella sp.]|tara:strand:+ start:1409 stop:2608 length:1200 start_codon:yes stop_codon:yes gene_type:complete
MKLALEQRHEEFREEVRAFLQENLPADLAEAGRLTTSVFVEPEFSLPWQRILYEKGWVAPHWPEQYGGPGWDEMQKYIFASECARAGAPSLSPMGLQMVGPCIMGFGTQAQKDYYLPRILAGEDYWCQGYSEPGAGSDLASLKLQAVSDGEDYVLNGSKIWTTHAHHANRMFCLVRTNSDGKPQRGITFLLLDMTLPGIKVDPIITLAGEHEVNQVFFDEVRVPKSGRLGEEDDGWTVAKYLLEFERGGGSSAGLEVALERVAAIAVAESDNGATVARDSGFARRYADACIALEAVKITEQRVAAALAGGQNPGAASSMLKTARTETMQRIDELAVEAAGPYGNVEQITARQPGANMEMIGPRHSVTAMPRYLNNRAGSIYGGSNEVQRNVMAKLLLGL